MNHVTSVSLVENTSYTLNFDLSYSGNPSDMMITIKDPSQATLYSCYIFLTQDGLAGVSFYTAQLVSAQDYYPFGSTLPGRTFQDGRFDRYRFGFNGMEKMDEINGFGNALDFGARVYDGRLGGGLSVALGLFPDPG